MKIFKRLLPVLLGAVGMLTVVSGANALEYPTRPVRLIVPFAAGGGLDIVARELAQKLTEHWGQRS